MKLSSLYYFPLRELSGRKPYQENLLKNSRISIQNSKVTKMGGYIPYILQWVNLVGLSVFMTCQNITKILINNNNNKLLCDFIWIFVFVIILVQYLFKIHVFWLGLFYCQREISQPFFSFFFSSEICWGGNFVSC